MHLKEGDMPAPGGVYKMWVEEALAGGMAAEISINLVGNHIIPMRQKVVGAFDA
jgi:hypothetical protein